MSYKVGTYESCSNTCNLQNLRNKKLINTDKSKCKIHICLYVTFPTKSYFVPSLRNFATFGIGTLVFPTTNKKK